MEVAMQWFGPMTPFVLWTFLFLTGCAIVAAASYTIGYAWSMLDERREGRWEIAAEGAFDSITHGVRQRIRLQDGRGYQLVLAHKELYLERGEPVRILENRGRYRVERRH
jgi:hypothetical protein